MLAALSWPARLLAAGGMLAAFSCASRHWPTLRGVSQWLWRGALALGIAGCCLIPAFHGRGPLAQPGLALAVIGVGMGLGAFLLPEATRGLWACPVAIAMLLALLENVVCLAVVAEGWWFALAEILWLVGLGALSIFARDNGSQDCRRMLGAILGAQAVSVGLAEVGARISWAVSGLSEPVLVARMAGLLITVLAWVWLGEQGATLSRTGKRSLVTAVVLMTVWGGVHVCVVALCGTPSLYLWR